MDLSGTWRAHGASEELRRAFPDAELDDTGWPAVDVPGHWRSADAFAGGDGPLLYRRRFETAGAPGRRRWLVFDGVFYQGDVWLDGAYLGDTEGYFFPHTFEVTEPLAASAEHVLAVEVTCAPPGDRRAKRNLTGVFQHWDCIDPGWNPGGIWRPVRIEETGPVRISRLRCLCADATEDRATLRFSASVDAAEATTAAILTTVGDHDHRLERALAAGANHVEWAVTIESPRLWWPRALGPQNLYDVGVEVHVGGDGGPGEGEPSDRRRFRTGLRQVRMDRWVLRVNGERIFLKGANAGPARMALAEATPAELAGDVRLAAEAGLDLLRVHGHVTRPELYDAADAAGVLVWQDLPLQWGYARGLRKQAVRQAREAVDLLGHHPSVYLWCGHNAPFRVDSAPGATGAPAAGTGRSLAREAAGQQLPSWNRSILDRSVKRALAKADDSRPVIAHSGVLPHAGSGGTDTHLYVGWYHGDERDLPGALAVWPRLARFVSEFGAQAVPETDAFCEPERWPDLDWDRLEQRHSLQREVFDARVPPAAHPTFASWKAATQAYQAGLIKHHVETLRRLKYRPSGGFAQFLLADAHPAVTWSVLDHERRPKAGYDALRAACAPVLVVADRPAARYAPGAAISLDVHVVNDTRAALDGVEVTARLSWPDGAETWRWGGDVGPDGCVRVGTVQAVAPDTEGPLVLDLHLRHDAATSENRYESVITR